MEQWHADHRGRLPFRHRARLGHDVDQHQHRPDETHRALHHRPMFGIGTLRAAGRAGREQDRRIVLGSHLRQRRIRPAAFFEHDFQSFQGQFVMFEDQQFGTVGALGFNQPLGSLIVGEYIGTTDILDAVGQFVATPPAVQLGRNGARHGDRHVEDDPVGRIARSDADPVAFLHAIAFDQAASQGAGGGISFPKGQADIAINQEFLVGVLVAEIGEIIGDILRRILEYRHVDAIFVDRGELQQLTRLRQRLECFVDYHVQFRSRHYSSLPLFPLGIGEFPFIWTGNHTGKRLD